MNIVLLDKEKGEYYVLSVKRSLNREGFIVRGKCVSPDGRVREFGQSFFVQTLSEANQRCRSMAKTKMRKRNYVEVPLDSLNEKVRAHLEPPPEMQVTAEEMIDFISRLKRERYVVFKDINGLEDWFDVGVEYIGYEIDDDFISVYDKFGKLRDCMKCRMSSIVPTESAIELCEKTTNSPVKGV